LREAADEIERLTAERDAWVARYNSAVADASITKEELRASREITAEQIDRGARALRQSEMPGSQWERLRPDFRESYLTGTEAVLRAALGVPTSPADESSEATPSVVLGARRLVTEVWRLVEAKTISSRSPAADAALDLRDCIDPKWEPTIRGASVTKVEDDPPTSYFDNGRNSG